MSTTEQEIGAENPDGNGLLCRSFAAEMSADDGRSIDVRIVPYGVTAEVSDDGRTRYREMWMQGAFADQVRGAQVGRASHVMVNFRHGQTFGDVIGHGVSLMERDDALYGTFKILTGPDGDKALELVRADALSKVSLEAFPKKTVRSPDGVVQRVKGHLVNIALTPQGAYDQAAVLAIREEQLAEEKIADTAAELDLDPEIVGRLRRAGIHLPARYDAVTEDAEQILQRAFTEASWDGSASRWDTAESYCSASAIDLNPAGQAKTKSACHLPYKEPGSGTINVNGVRAALARIGQGDPVDATQAQRDAAKSRLEKILASFNSSAS